jgi:programmed cell death protein 4
LSFFIGGAGGKHTWGAYGSELVDNTALDYKDPNYDSECLDNGDIHLEAIIPEISDDEIQKNVESTILEYFEVGDTNEVFSALGDLNFGPKKYQVLDI